METAAVRSHITSLNNNPVPGGGGAAAVGGRQAVQLRSPLADFGRGKDPDRRERRR